MSFFCFFLAPSKHVELVPNLIITLLINWQQQTHKSTNAQSVLIEITRHDSSASTSLTQCVCRALSLRILHHHHYIVNNFSMQWFWFWSSTLILTKHFHEIKNNSPYHFVPTPFKSHNLYHGEPNFIQQPQWSSALAFYNHPRFDLINDLWNYYSICSILFYLHFNAIHFHVPTQVKMR